MKQQLLSWGILAIPMCTLEGGNLSSGLSSAEKR